MYSITKYLLSVLLILSFAGTVSATTLNDSHGFGWIPTLSDVPTAFFQDVPTVSGNSFYDDSLPFFFDTCLNPGDSGDCYPTFGGPAEIGVGLSITMGGQVITTADFGANAFISVVPDGKFLFNPATPGVGLPGLNQDLLAISSQVGGNIFVGPGNRWQITGINVFARYEADTLSDPFGNSLVGTDLYSFGPDRELSLSIFDTTDGNVYTALAKNPEPSTAVLLGLGLGGLVFVGRRQTRQ